MSSGSGRKGINCPSSSGSESGDGETTDPGTWKRGVATHDIYTYVCVCVYIYIERETDRQTERETETETETERNKV